ncbi:MAG: response regulator, partial [Clostridiales bacterium]|nr:response regulator [Clostridiales bacterium]
NLQDYYKVDVMRLNQISINILSNAIKCTKGGGKIVWSNRIVEEENKVYLVQTIKDNGVGMSEEFQKVLFEPFTQEANPETKNELGTGLGLAITKNLISIMGGSIEFKSKLNKGTQFTITIPLEIATKEEIEQYKTINIKDKTEVDLSNKKILLCEDVEINARIIKKMLESKKLIVDLAENGKIGIDMAKKNKYDAIIMDIRMPIVDGIAATKEIRKFNKNIPIIALSANAYKEDIELSLEAGMNAHLSKPVNKDLLFKELCKYLGGENENN